MIEIIPNVLILFSFYIVLIIILFNTFISKSEANIIKTNVEYLVDNVSPNKYLTPKILKDDILNSLAIADNSEQLKNLDIQEENTNKDLIKSSVKNTLIISGIIILLAFAWCYFYKLDFKQIVLNNFIIIIFILFVELGFNYIFKSKYLIADPNIVKKEFYKQIL